MPRLGVTQQTAVIRHNVEAIARAFLAEEGPPVPSGCRALVALMGLPASGKSHFARLLAARLGAVIVASDLLRRRLFVAPSYARGETRTVFALAQAMARLLLLDGHTVIFDATNLRERDRRPLYALARAAGAGLVLVHVAAPEPVVRERLAIRSRRESPGDASDADARVFEMMRERYVPPARAFLTVASTSGLEAEVARVAAEVRRSCA